MNRGDIKKNSNRDKVMAKFSAKKNINNIEKLCLQYRHIFSGDTVQAKTLY